MKENYNLFDRFTQPTIKIILIAHAESRRKGADKVGAEDVIWALINSENRSAKSFVEESWKIRSGLKNSKNVDSLIGWNFTTQALNMLKEAATFADKRGEHDIAPIHLIAGILSADRSLVKRMLDEHSVAKQSNRRILNSHQLRKTAPSSERVGMSLDTIFDRFDDEAIQSVLLAQKHAYKLGQEGVETEHLLLGLTEVEAGIASQFLKSFGINLKEIELKIAERCQLVNVSYENPLDLPLSPRVKKVMKLAQVSAHATRQFYIETQDILIGIIDEGTGTAAEILSSLDIDLKQLRIEIANMSIESKGQRKN